MKKFLLVFLFILFAVAHLWAQTDQTVTNGAATTAVNFTGSGCTYNWVNSNPSIGLPASGTGNIPSFTAVNTGSSSVTATITATPAPNGFAYITNYKDNTVSVINTANNVLVTTIPVGSGPFGLSVSTDGNRVYITNRNDNTVSVINTSNNTVIATIPVGTFPWGVSVAPNGKRVYVTNSNDNTVSVIDNATNSVITTINVDKSPIGVSVSPDGSLVYVACYFTGTISVISTTTNKVVSTIQAGSYADGVIVSPDGNRIYVDDPINDNLYVIDATNGKVISIIKIGSECLGISISPDGTRVYTVNQADGTVSVNPVLTVTYSGFVNKDNAAALNPPVTVTTTATVTSAIGLYPIIVYGAGSVNYNLTYMPGTMTIQSLFLIIPNTFTPNGDGINDTWNIENLESYPNSSVNIFNRWGQKLYASIGYPVP
jgi:YVTN family beta-propeller protein